MALAGSVGAGHPDEVPPPSQRRCSGQIPGPARGHRPMIASAASCRARWSRCRCRRRGIGAAGEVGEAAAGLLDDHLERGQVPERHLRVEAISATPSATSMYCQASPTPRVRQHARPSSTIASNRPDRVPVLDPAPRHLRVGQLARRPRRGSAGPSANAPRAARRPPAASERRHRDDADGRRSSPRPRARSASTTSASRGRSSWCRRSGR